MQEVQKGSHVSTDEIDEIEKTKDLRFGLRLGDSDRKRLDRLCKKYRIKSRAIAIRAALMVLERTLKSGVTLSALFKDK
jgi:hypothetical protein